MTAALRTVRLYGHLGERFGREHRFAVASAAEAVRALRANFPGIDTALVGHRPGYRVWVGGAARGPQDLWTPGAGPIRIVPVVAGAKNKGPLQIILGAALIAAPFAFPGLAATAFAGTTLGAISTSLGISMVLGGVSSLLFSPPRAETGATERPESRPSYIFDGPVNTTVQGNPVPIGYGRLRVGSQVVSAGLSVEVLPP